MSDVLKSNSEDKLVLLKACLVPKSGNEVMKLKTKKDVFLSLVELKTAGCISFLDGKYFTTDKGKALL